MSSMPFQFCSARASQYPPLYLPHHQTHRMWVSQTLILCCTTLSSTRRTLAAFCQHVYNAKGNPADVAIFAGPHGKPHHYSTKKCCSEGALVPLNRHSSIGVHTLSTHRKRIFSPAGPLRLSLSRSSNHRGGSEVAPILEQYSFSRCLQRLSRTSFPALDCTAHLSLQCPDHSHVQLFCKIIEILGRDGMSDGDRVAANHMPHMAAI